MELTDFTVYLWLWPAVVHLLLPLAVSAVGLGVFIMKRAGKPATVHKEHVSEPLSA